MHVCSILRVLVGHSGRALLPEKGQWVSFWRPSDCCRPAYSQTASVCDVYPSSHSASRHVGPLGVLLSRLSVYCISLSILMVLGHLEILVSSEQWFLLCMELLLLFTPTRMWVKGVRLFGSTLPSLTIPIHVKQCSLKKMIWP